ncbi:MAG: hypothetical protein V7L27_05840 [Nostoc sp.]
MVIVADVKVWWWMIVINQISDAVSRRKLVCFISDRDRNFLRATLGLPMHFQAYPLTNEPEDRHPRYTITFGQDALLLETLTWHWKPKDDEDGYVRTRGY